jgi:hypothetical protein
VVSSNVELKSEVIKTGVGVLCPCELEASGEGEVLRMVGIRELAELLCSTDRGIVDDLTSEDVMEIRVLPEFENV